MAKKSKVGAVADSVSVEKVASYVDEVVADHNKVVASFNVFFSILIFTSMSLFEVTKTVQPHRSKDR